MGRTWTVYLTAASFWFAMQATRATNDSGSLVLQAVVHDERLRLGQAPEPCTWERSRADVVVGALRGRLRARGASRPRTVSEPANETPHGQAHGVEDSCRTEHLDDEEHVVGPHVV